ncbi:hypothetical protein [Streptomyces sp. t39]|uniref:hypothetical protein n=1 Tax=Streptomyces sp. t39 TaxID=1828156 RepID=UPI0011CE97B0|nr:hypothetical protein [Streptomyces sp. t39]TXS51690.1 hypothetical protein EAO77_24575 [Streptomyces sp. t39]
MTPTVPSDALAPGRLRPALRAVAIASCVPYLALKAAWIAGSRIGIPDGSVLLEDRAVTAAANGLTVLMDAAVIVLAVLLTRPWGLRVRAWVLTVPMWAATGLLAPIMVGFPLHLAAGALGGSSPQEISDEPFLDAWVFDVVYTGFIVQGIALGTLFVLCARQRWGHLWQGTLWTLPTSATGPRMRGCAVAGALIALGPAVMHVLWAAGSTLALPAGTAAGRSTDFRLLESMHAAFAVAAMASVLTLAFRAVPSLSLRPVLAVAWTSASALGAWGGWMLLATLLPSPDDADRATAPLALTYAGAMISGLLLSGAIASLLRRRGA